MGTSSLRWGLLVLLCAVASACDAPASDQGKGEGSVCPTCRRTVGGETGDFGAAIVACGYSQSEVDVEQAEALGYPAKAVARAASRPIDVPMTWMPLDSKGGGAASGYDRHTRVFVSLSIDSFMYNELDVDGCDMYPDPETIASCRLDTAAGTCGSPHIVVNGSAEVHTSDGAVMATLPSQIIEILRRSSYDISFGGRVDLRDVHGTLRLDPTLPEPHVGFLYLEIEYTPNVKLRYGDLYVDVFFDDLQLDGGGGGGGYRPPNNTDYMPLRGVWGTFPYDDSAQVGREDDAGTR